MATAKAVNTNRRDAEAFDDIHRHIHEIKEKAVARGDDETGSRRLGLLAPAPTVEDLSTEGSIKER